MTRGLDTPKPVKRSVDEEFLSSKSAECVTWFSNAGEEKNVDIIGCLDLRDWSC